MLCILRGSPRRLSATRGAAGVFSANGGSLSTNENEVSRDWSFCGTWSTCRAEWSNEELLRHRSGMRFSGKVSTARCSIFSASISVLNHIPMFVGTRMAPVHSSFRLGQVSLRVHMLANAQPTLRRWTLPVSGSRAGGPCNATITVCSMCGEHGHTYRGIGLASISGGWLVLSGVLHARSSDAKFEVVRR
ncbi:hypothetical protein OH76DRAFT_904508 [Lentinus brumalis]|uniref:Uncharacterized protein n=1 Tax=Lentinus brumalis TaxID=2498619 RepID=A0A371D0D7_9APHY|nr:hypothetical protein OH76DRAFT_904508 [Polyporus brumalis]